MPIINPTPSAPPTVVTQPIRVAPQPYRGVTVDTRYVPVSSLLTHIEGSPWTVEYYSQVVNADNNVDGQATGRSSAYQQYKLIHQMQLMLQGSLSFSQDESNAKSVVYTGECVAYPFLIPNVGDMFLADVGDGREAVFEVLTSDAKSIYTQTCYGFTFKTVDWSTPQRLRDFAAKTVETLQFVKDFLNYGQNPLVTTSEYATLSALAPAYYSTLKTWSAEFFSTEFGTWMIPGQPKWIYDSFLVGAMTKWTLTTDTPEIRKVRQLNVGGDQQLLLPTLWDALLTRDLQILRRINERMGLVSVYIFSPDPMLESIRYSGVDLTVYPYEPIPTWDESRGRGPAALSAVSLTPVPPRRTRLADALPSFDLDGLPYEGRPLINPVTVDNYYVFSEAFYARDEANMSRLELAAWSYLKGDALDLALLNTLIQSYQSWGGLERFYYTPVILMLIKAMIRSL